MMNKDKKLFTCLYGSRLYGTNTPTSDRDIKHIVLPSLDSLLLAKHKVANKVHKTNKVEHTKNTQDDVDEEFIPLQIFARDFMMGQTYALELAFAVDSDHAEQEVFTLGTEDEALSWYFASNDRKHLAFFQFVRELKEQFLTSNIKAMMGYVVNQASLYSFKGERLNAVKEFMALLKHEEVRSEMSIQLLMLDDTINEPFVKGTKELAMKYPKYFQIKDYDIGDGRMRPSFSLLEKTVPWTSTVGHTLGVVSKLAGKYGDRAESASESNVDWKATMHAVRIVDEGISLLENGFMTLPLPKERVDYLLSMKRGELPLDPIKEELETKLASLKELEHTSPLQAYTPELNVKFDAWMITWLRRFYKL